ncbi:MAG: hypothetical protein NC409_08575 [Clostridium sp.]|nr:hypothetical protein [Clostridium sp.]
MKGFSRSLRYFSIMAAEYIGLCALVMVLCFLSDLFRHGGSLSGIGASFVTVMLLILCFFIATISIGFYVIIPPIILSVSGTRRQIFWGARWMVFLIVFAILLLTGISCLFFDALGGRWFLKLLPSFIGLFAMADGLGSLLASFALCCGKAAAVVMSVCSGILGGIVGFCSAFFDFGSERFSALTASLTGGVPYLLFAGLLVLLIGSTVIRWLVLHKTAVNQRGV